MRLKCFSLALNETAVAAALETREYATRIAAESMINRYVISCLSHACFQPAKKVSLPSSREMTAADVRDGINDERDDTC